MSFRVASRACQQVPLAWRKKKGHALRRGVPARGEAAECRGEMAPRTRKAGMLVHRFRAFPPIRGGKLSESPWCRSFGSIDLECYKQDPENWLIRVLFGPGIWVLSKSTKHVSRSSICNQVRGEESGDWFMARPFSCPHLTLLTFQYRTYFADLANFAPWSFFVFPFKRQAKFLRVDAWPSPVTDLFALAHHPVVLNG